MAVEASYRHSDLRVVLARIAGILVLVLAERLAFVAPAAAEPGLQDAVGSFLNDLSRGDVESAMARLDDEPSYRGLWVCEPEPCIGRMAVRAALVYEAADATRFRLDPDSVRAEDETGVRARGEMQCASLAAIAERVVFDLQAEGSGGGVVSIRLMPDPTDGPTRRVMDEVAAVQALLDDAGAAGIDGPITLGEPAP
jgi:hypothetical protein